MLHWVIEEKHPNMGGWRYNFLKTTLEFFIFYFIPRNYRQNKVQPLDIQQNFQVQKQRPLKNPHYFFLVTLGNSTTSLITPGNSTCYFFDNLEIPYPQPPCLDFSGIAHSALGYSWKNPNSMGAGGWRYIFLKTSLEFLIFSLHPWKFQTKQNSTPGSAAQNCY